MIGIKFLINRLNLKHKYGINKFINQFFLIKNILKQYYMRIKHNNNILKKFFFFEPF